MIDVTLIKINNNNHIFISSSPSHKSFKDIISSFLTIVALLDISRCVSFSKPQQNRIINSLYIKPKNVIIKAKNKFMKK